MTRIALAFTLIAFAFSGCACEDREGATRALTGLGFKNIQLGDPKVWWSGCGEHDIANNPFTAVNSAGQTVSGVVCCGGPLNGKACTVRF